MSDAPISSSPPQTVEVTLETPISRESGGVSSISLRKPKAGELRGLNLQDIMQSDVNAMVALLPRISHPFLTPQEVEQLDPADFAELAGAVVGFFYTPSQRAMIAKAFGG